MRLVVQNSQVTLQFFSIPRLLADSQSFLDPPFFVLDSFKCVDSARHFRFPPLHGLTRLLNSQLFGWGSADLKWVLLPAERGVKLRRIHKKVQGFALVTYEREQVAPPPPPSLKERQVVGCVEYYTMLKSSYASLPSSGCPWRLHRPHLITACVRLVTVEYPRQGKWGLASGSHSVMNTK